MRRFFQAILACSFLVVLSFTSGVAAVKIEQDKEGKTYGLAGLFSDPTCAVRTLSGKIVSRSFADDAVSLTGFVIEDAEGVRTFVNAEIPTGLSMAARAAVFDGLQRLSKVGRVVRISTAACGVAGRVLTLDQIHAASR